MNLSRRIVWTYRLPALLLLALACAWSAIVQAQAAPRVRQIRPLDAGWSFLAADAKGAEQPGFDSAAWSKVSVPHDWSIAGPLDKANPTGQGGGYFPNGIGWYRKEIPVTPADAKRHVYVVFDGVMANSDVWINGFHLGTRPNGYITFMYDLTPHLQFGAGAKNILTVKCDNSKQPASRWYEGAGIYRNARLVVTQDVHLDPWSVVVTTPSVDAAKAVVHVQGTVVNDGSGPAKGGLKFSLFGPDGKPVGSGLAALQPIAKGSALKFAVDIPVASPRLWNLESPSLYKVVAQVQTEAGVSDDEQIQFGIREFHFDANTGFWLNGKNFKVKGAAMHIDGGAVGIAVPPAVYEHRLLALKALGVNAIRTAHNPPSPEFLDICDKLGLLVMEEMFDQWTVAKNPFDYHLAFQEWAIKDTRDTVRRDRNHPSIILWSAGNEIHDTPQTALANKILTALVATFHDNDATRPVTQALFRPNVSHDYDNGLADLLDVVGQNYREGELLAAHEAKPTRKIIGTENGPDRAIWLAMRDHAPMSGQFLWTGVDYLGEAGEAGGWPIYANGSGLIDKTGYPRARGYERQSWWSDTPNIHAARRVAATEKLNVDPGYEAAPKRFQQTVFADWTPQNTAPHSESVEVYTNCEEADLLLNGTSLGKQKLHPDASPMTWKVDYAPGTLEAVAYIGGKEVSRDTLRTATKAARILLTAEKPTVTSAPGDLVFLEATVRDEAGNKLVDSGTPIQFSVKGPGVIVAVDSGNNADHDPFQATARKTFQGRSIVLVRATGAGELQVTATSPGLASGAATVKALRAQDPTVVRSF